MSNTLFGLFSFWGVLSYKCLLVFSSLIAQIVYLLLNKYGHFIWRVKTVVLALFCS